MHDALCDRRSRDDAPAASERRRDEAAGAAHGPTCARSSREPPPPPLADQRAALVADPAGTERSSGVLAGTVPVEDVLGAPATT